MWGPPLAAPEGGAALACKPHRLGEGRAPHVGAPKAGRGGVHRGGEPVGMRRARARGVLLWISVPPIPGGYVPRLSLPTSLGRGDTPSRRSLPKG